MSLSASSGVDREGGEQHWLEGTNSISALPQAHAECAARDLPVPGARICRAVAKESCELPAHRFHSPLWMCQLRDIPTMAASESFHVGLCLPLVILSVQRSGLMKFLNICRAKLPGCTFQHPWQLMEMILCCTLSANHSGWMKILRYKKSRGLSGHPPVG